MEYQDYYKILGLSKDASTDDIQRAYRKLARKYHPDVSKDVDAEVKFKQINEAKEVLKDPEKRKLYDRYGKDWDQAGQQPPPGWDRGRQSRRGQEGYSRPFNYGSGEDFQSSGDFSDFFNNLFGDRAAGGSTGPRYGRGFDSPGSSQEAEITVSLADVYHGATKTISFQTYEVSEHGQLEPTARTLQVKIPKGVTNGSVIRLAGQGEKGYGQGPAGDLLLRITIAPDPQFRLEGHDLHTTVAVSPWEAALGAKIPVLTVEGSVTLSIPAGTQNGKRFRLKGKGIPKKKSGAGDIIVEAEIRVPERLSDEEQKLFEELSRQSRFNPRDQLRQRAKHEKV